MPSVSVIVPAYGHAEFILQTLDSIFAQTFTDYEVIVINDGSPDDTSVVLAPLVKSGKIRYVEQSNQGVAAARNLGISISVGDFIALLDDDDIWPPNKLEWQVSALKETRALAVGGGVSFIIDDDSRGGDEFDNKRTDLDITRFFRGNPFTSPGQVLFRRIAFTKGVRFDPSIWGADDLDFWIGLTQHGTIVYVNQLALRYRVHRSNASRNTVRMMANCRKVVEKRLPYVSKLESRNCSKAAYRWLFMVYGVVLVRNLKGSFAFSFNWLRDAATLGKELGKAFCRPSLKDIWIPIQFLKVILRR